MSIKQGHTCDIHIYETLNTQWAWPQKGFPRVCLRFHGATRIYLSMFLESNKQIPPYFAFIHSSRKHLNTVAQLITAEPTEGDGGKEGKEEKHVCSQYSSKRNLKWCSKTETILQQCLRTRKLHKRFPDWASRDPVNRLKRATVSAGTTHPWQEITFVNENHFSHLRWLSHKATDLMANRKSLSWLMSCLLGLANISDGTSPRNEM